MSKSQAMDEAKSLESGTEIDTIAEVIMAKDTIANTYLLGRFDPAKHEDFEKITATHGAGSGLGAYLHKETLAAFKEMHAAAKEEGVKLTIRSATRNFFRQKQIWEAKWTGARKVGGKDLSKSKPDPTDRATEILLFSSMPGTSRHHWGTDMDLNAFENSYFASGKGLKEYEWLKAHAAEYGFGQPYTEKGEGKRPFGYEEEKWHWSYLPLARKLLKAYSAQIVPTDIQGFKGAEVAEELKVIERYVEGIAPECK
ncbi:MAG: M15 family metallopeptidase [Bacteroidia bacterium]|nr:M15 family metallopeptidase [Bacteroidia bacterium]